MSAQSSSFFILLLHYENEALLSFFLCAHRVSWVPARRPLPVEGSVELHSHRAAPFCPSGSRNVFKRRHTPARHSSSHLKSKEARHGEAAESVRRERLMASNSLCSRREKQGVANPREREGAVLQSLSLNIPATVIRNFVFFYLAVRNELKISGINKVFQRRGGPPAPELWEMDSYKRASNR